MKKLAVIGLDCVPPELAFDRLAGRMPFLTGLRGNCLWGRLRSTDPPITVPAWSAMTTGMDPGALGLYGFRNRTAHDYQPPRVCDASSVSAPRLWDLAGEAGLRSIVLGVPQTYPPRPLNGLLVAGFLSPGPESRFTFPAGFKAELERLAGGPYLIDVRDFRQKEPGELLAEIEHMTRRRFKLARSLLAKEPWDFFMMVEMGPDRLHHGFWQYFDPKHPKYDPASPFSRAIPDYYAGLDTHLAGLWESLPPDTLVLMVSDHGAQPLRGSFAVNQWLIQKGWLRLKHIPAKPAPLEPGMVDWPRTLAWADGGYYARLYLNLAGREPQGALAPGKAALFLEQLRADLEAEAGEDGRPLGNRVFRPQELYPAVKGFPPDLMLYPGGLSLRAAATVGWEQVLLEENDTGPDGANHSPFGIYAAAVKGSPAPVAGGGDRSILDIAPTVLDWLGLTKPKNLAGRSFCAELPS